MIEPDSLPAHGLRARAGERGGHGLAHGRAGRERDAVAVADEAQEELAVLDDRRLAPAIPPGDVSREAHSRPVQPARPAEDRVRERAEVIAQMERELANPDERTVLGHGDQVQGLDGLVARTQMVRHDPNEVVRELAVRVHYHERVDLRDLQEDLVGEPVEGRPLSAPSCVGTLVHARAVLASDRRGVVGAVVRDDVDGDVVSGMPQTQQPIDRATEELGLVVRRHQDREDERTRTVP